MASQHPEYEKILHFMKEIRSTKGIIRSAFVSRENGIPREKCRDEVLGALHAAVTATMYPSAETSDNPVSLPEQLYSVSSTMNVPHRMIRAGEKMLIGAVMDCSKNFSQLFEHIITTRIGGEVIV